MGNLTVLILKELTKPEHFDDLNFDIETPKDIENKLLLRGRKPIGGKIWKMTKTANGNGDDIIENVSLTKNGLIDGDEVYVFAH